ncbi:MAG TPA: hypothetical protein VLE23_01460 [Geminicoccaceae bacterium]|nr:hypothetical protein [Geminicoccaceae bacterium]
MRRPVSCAMASSGARPILAYRPETTPFGGSLVDDLEQARRARVDRVEAVPESRHVAHAAPDQRRVLGGDGIFERGTLSDPRGDPVVKLDRLLAGGAVHVAQDVDRRGHRAVDADAAGHRHARDRDRGRLRPVVDRGHQRGAEQLGLPLAAQHQPDHHREVDPPDQLLDRIAVIADHAGPHLDDRGRPRVLAELPVTGIAHIVLSSRSAAISASS